LNWDYVQNVWTQWQALNVGMLAFISSVIALNISKISANKQRIRNFIAARAFLPESLSELVTYFEESSILLKEAWERGKFKNDYSKLNSSLPELPSNYRTTFSKCIMYAEPEVSETLAFLLNRLQVHHSRITSLYEHFGSGAPMNYNLDNIKSYIFSLGELLAIVNRIFGFARGEEMFDNKKLDIGEFRTAYSILDIYPEEVGELIDCTKRFISRKNKLSQKS